jgi:hypothetical protein
MNRYAGNPLARLGECYVLKTLGELPPNEESQLMAMEPTLPQIYGASGSWMDVIAFILKFPPEMPGTIQEMWKQNQEIGRANGIELQPQQFAQMFVDSNFGPE